MFDGNLQPLGSRPYDFVPLPAPLCSEQIDRVRRYTANTLWAKKDRVIEFYKGERGEIFLRDVSTAAYQGLKIGASIGAPLGLVGRVIYEAIVPVAYKWPMRAAYYVGSMILGALGGGAAGASSCSVITCVIQFSEDMGSDEYRRWRLDKINTAVMNSFSETIHREDLRLLGFICPISQHLIEVPYTTSNRKHTFEKDCILEWLRRVSPGIHERAFQAPTREERMEILKQTSPYQDEYIREQDLIYDWEYHPNLCQEINKVINENNGRLERRLSPDVIEGLQKFKTSATMPSARVIDEMVLIANRMFRNGEISDSSLLQRIRTINTYYQPFILSPQEQPQIEQGQPPALQQDQPLPQIEEGRLIDAAIQRFEQGFPLPEPVVETIQQEEGEYVVDLEDEQQVEENI